MDEKDVELLAQEIEEDKEAKFAYKRVMYAY